MNKKIMIYIGVLAALSVGIWLFLSKSKSAYKDASVFVVGTAAGYAPYVSINERGDYVGFDVDVANALAQQMDKKLVLKDLGSMASLFIALEQGTIDAIIWGLSITQDRLKKVAMIQYAGEETTAYKLMFWKSIPSTIRSIADMAGKTVCVEPASAQDAVLSKYAFITKVPTEKVDDGLLNIQYGKADAAFVEPTIAKKFKNKFPEIKLLDVPLAPEDQVKGIGIAIKQDNATCIRDVQQAVDQLKEQGVIRKLEQQWDIS